MTDTVRIVGEGSFRQHCPDGLTIPTSDGQSIADVLRQVPKESGLRQLLSDESGRLHQAMLIFVNEEPVPWSETESRRVSDGDEIVLYPPISGG